jgi:hypothetical protein
VHLSNFKTVFIENEQTTAPVGANTWANRRLQIKNACKELTAEELGLYECMALTSWESR